MKKLILTTVSIAIFTTGILFSPKTAKSQTLDEQVDPNRLVYWFYVSVREIKDPETGYKIYQLQRKGNKISSGSLKRYDRDLWRNLSSGSKMAIGPFNNQEEAERAFVFYKVQDEPHLLDAEFDPKQQIFWFILHVKKRPRSRSYELERKPGAVASGTYRDFENFLKENLKMRVMTIGPFLYMAEAEEAKRTYRLH